MVRHDDVARAWSNRCKATGSRMFTDGKTVFSYGRHFPVGHFMKDGTVLFNSDKYSVSTSAHQTHVLRHCSPDYYVNTEEIQQAIDYPDKPLVLVREKEIERDELYEYTMTRLKKYLRGEGVDFFPKIKIDKFLNEIIKEWKNYHENKNIGYITAKNEYGYIEEFGIYYLKNGKITIKNGSSKYSEYELLGAIENRVIENTIPKEIMQKIEQKAVIQNI